MEFSFSSSLQNFCFSVRNFWSIFFICSVLCGSVLSSSGRLLNTASLWELLCEGFLVMKFKCRKSRLIFETCLVWWFYIFSSLGCLASKLLLCTTCYTSQLWRNAKWKFWASECCEPVLFMTYVSEVNFVKIWRIWGSLSIIIPRYFLLFLSVALRTNCTSFSYLR